VVRRVRELGAECVLGNHEDRHLRWADHEEKRRSRAGYRNPMNPLDERTRLQHDAFSAEDLAFLRTLPPYLRLDTQWLAVHGGFLPNHSPEEQSHNVVLRLRYLDERDHFVSLGDELIQPPGTVRWATRWPGPENVVYGHAVHDLVSPRIDRTASGGTCFGLDTGCCFGGRLTALVLPSLEIVQVAARKEYVPLRRPNGSGESTLRTRG
jgi:diadenosine tetraphosphatase ApaH/serine/threonine PP2A family protein phosphatase